MTSIFPFHSMNHFGQSPVLCHNPIRLHRQHRDRIHSAEGRGYFSVEQDGEDWPLMIYDGKNSGILHPVVTIEECTTGRWHSEDELQIRCPRSAIDASQLYF